MSYTRGEERKTVQGIAYTLGTKTLSFFYLELRNHVLLRVVRDTLVAEEPATQMLLVVPFKHILLLHEAEQHHGLVEDRLHLLFC